MDSKALPMEPWLGLMIRRAIDGCHKPIKALKGGHAVSACIHLARILILLVEADPDSDRPSPLMAIMAMMAWTSTGVSCTSSRHWDQCCFRLLGAPASEDSPDSLSRAAVAATHTCSPH